jgi:hypothetical protein
MKQQQWPEVVDNIHYLWIPVTVTSRDESYLVYVPITKCASTYISNALPTHEFNSRLWRYCDDRVPSPVPDRALTKWFVVLRDPWDRWISGAIHWLSHCQEWPDRSDDAIERIEMDVHTCPQHEFLTDVDLDRTIFMRYHLDIGQHAWFRMQGWRLWPVLRERSNITERADIRQALQDRITTADKYRIKDYYHEDYELIRTARFI